MTVGSYEHGMLKTTYKYILDKYLPILLTDMAEEMYMHSCLCGTKIEMKVWIKWNQDMLVLKQALASILVFS